MAFGDAIVDTVLSRLESHSIGLERQEIDELKIFFFLGVSPNSEKTCRSWLKLACGKRHVVASGEGTGRYVFFLEIVSAVVS